MTNELKPCPFCGGEAETNVYGATGEWAVKCPCGAEMNIRVYTEEEAIAAWNTRAERTCQRVLYKPTGVLVCSECGAGIPKQLDKYCYLHYCPNCGARVEGVE